MLRWSKLGKHNIMGANAPSRILRNGAVSHQNDWQKAAQPAVEVRAPCRIFSLPVRSHEMTTGGLGSADHLSIDRPERTCKHTQDKSGRPRRVQVPSFLGKIFVHIENEKHYFLPYVRSKSQTNTVVQIHALQRIEYCYHRSTLETFLIKHTVTNKYKLEKKVFVSIAMIVLRPWRRRRTGRRDELQTGWAIHKAAERSD